MPKPYPISAASNELSLLREKEKRVRLVTLVGVLYAGASPQLRPRYCAPHSLSVFAHREHCGELYVDELSHSVPNCSRHIR